MDHGRILAIDDEQNIRHLIENEFSLEGFDVTTAGSGEEGLGCIDNQAFDVVLLDIRLPKMNGIETLRQLKQKSPHTEVIMITGYGDIKSAVESVKLGARDYITKPFKLHELLILTRQAIKESRESVESRKKTDSPPRTRKRGKEASGFIRCPSRKMQNIYALASRVAPTESTLLIHGETGVGKDVLAFQIHHESARSAGPFITLDCGLLTNNLAESELYGHRKGAFSGASEAKIGLVEKSHNGTLFLDEIGNIAPDLQKKLLRFLETRKFRRVGETTEKEVDTRIILATNMNLEEAMKKGEFRMDLFYRMAVISITIPPLKDRPEDIAPLSQHFLNLASDKKLSDEAMKMLMEYSWPGNIRELKSVISKAVIMTDNAVITPDDLPSHLVARQKTFSQRSKSLEDMEREHIMAVLEETGGNQTRASEILRINRKTLYKKIHKYKIFS